MLLAAKSAIPTSDRVVIPLPAVFQALEQKITLFTAPPGYVPIGSLAAALYQCQRPILWLRAAPEDHDPGVFLLSLINAARRLVPGVGASTLELMRRHPGPMLGWPALFAHLADELATALPADCCLVIEHIHFLNDSRPTLGLLGNHLLPVLIGDRTLILTAAHDLPEAALPPQTIGYGASDLRLAEDAVLALAGQLGSQLSRDALYRVVKLAKGQATIVAGIFAAETYLGAAMVQNALKGAASPDDLLMHIAESWLSTASAELCQAIGLALDLDYGSPALNEAALGSSTVMQGPWFQPLHDGWSLLRAEWRKPLSLALRSTMRPSSEALGRAANFLVKQGALIQAVPIAIALQAFDEAGRIIAAAADTMMNLGLWATLEAWQIQLPTTIFQSWPWLAYTSGEMAAARGEIELAQRNFSLATAAFINNNDTNGVCQSLLAESAVAAWNNNYSQSQALALAASAKAEALGLIWHQGWAAWQLGCLAAKAGDADTALVYLGRAMQAAAGVKEPGMNELLNKVEDLLLQQRELGGQREFYRQAYFAVEQAERDVSVRLQQLLAEPPDDLDAIIGAHGWSHTPLMLKLTAPASLAPVQAAPEERPSLWKQVLGALGMRRRSEEPAPIPEPVVTPPATGATTRVVVTADNFPLLVTPPPTAGRSPVNTGSLVMVEPVTQVLHRPATPANGQMLPAAPAVNLNGPTRIEKLDSAAVDTELLSETASVPTLTVSFLGQFRVSVNDRPIENWPKGKGRAILKYLLAHRERPISREVLMETFWAETDPERMRNNLHVSIHGLRRALRSVTDVEIIEFSREDGVYRLASDLHVWIDVEEFEQHVKVGRQMEAAGQFASAVASYERAANLYQGDFLAEDSYEEWPAARRESLRLDYIDILDRLSQIYFSQGHYTTCVTLCQLILARDNCREDAHCRLMRCYSRQGQHHLALRQYQVCVKALKDELEVEPDSTTIQLVERIRRRERV
jgi:DNA-binding SARP family transcriptional activator